MAKADIKMSNGTHVTVDGTADEVKAILYALHSGKTPETSRKESKERRKTTKRKKPSPAKPQKIEGPQQYTDELISEGFFKTKRNISDVQCKLEELGHIYPLTSLSAPLLRLVKKKKIRRIKEKGNWVYVNV